MFEFLPWWMYVVDFIAIITAVVAWGEFKSVNSAWQASTIVLLLAGVATLFLSTASPLEWISHNPSLFIGELVAYALIGIIWAIIHWWTIYLKSDYVESLIKSNYRLYRVHPDDSSFEKSFYYPFTFAKNSGMIISWAVFWPIHIIKTFFSEILYNIFDWIGKIFSSFFARLASARVNEVIQDINEKNKS